MREVGRKRRGRGKRKKMVGGVRSGGEGIEDFFFQAEDGIRDLVRSRGLGDVYERQVASGPPTKPANQPASQPAKPAKPASPAWLGHRECCLLYTSDAADE